MPRDNSVSDIEDSLRGILDSQNDMLKKQVNTNSAILKEREKANAKENEANKKTATEINSIYQTSNKKIAKEQKDTAEEVGEIQKKKSNEAAKAFALTIASSLDGAMNSISSKYKQFLNEYTQQQQKLAFNLLGTGMTYDQVRDSLSALSTNSYIRQTDVYRNLTQLVSSGITLNASQRAFLQTASNQVDLGFNTLDANLNRLIQLQETDLSEARMAQMAGLKQFLEQNYQNSQYIKQGFSQVSDALLEMQSLMSAQMAMSTEKTIQTYLGAFSSRGGSSSSVSAIAQALGAIGSGDFSGLSEGMQNLMVMAASRAGLSYADLLLNGLDNTKSEQLMTRLLSYVADMSNMGGGSNVAMNAVAKMFGVTVSDIRAAQQMGISGINVNNVNSDIADFLKNLAATTNRSTQAATLFDNLISNRAAYGDLLSYNLTEGIAGLFSGVPIFGPFLANIPALSVLTGVLGDASSSANGGSMIASLLGNIQGINLLSNILGDGLIGGIESTVQQVVAGAVDRLVGGISNGYEGLLSDYYWFDNGQSLYSTSGSFTNTLGASTSAKLSRGANAASTTMITSVQDVSSDRTFNDLYDVVTDSNSTPYTTISNIVSANNAVLIGSQEITNSIVDSITSTAVNTQNIYDLLESWGFNRTTRSMAPVVSDNSALLYGDWAGSSTS